MNRAVTTILLVSCRTILADHPFMFSPSSRSIDPVSIFRTSGNVVAKDVNELQTLTGPNASITYDFGYEVAGIPTLTFGSSHCDLCSVSELPGFICGRSCDGIGVAYTEAAQFAGPESDLSTLYTHQDGTFYVPVTVHKEYTVPASNGRGGFRYLTLSLSPEANSDRSVDVAVSSVYYTAQPSNKIPSNYSSHFISSDNLLNHVWYAAAHTLQLCTVPANTSVQHSYIFQRLPNGWAQNATVTGFTGSDEILTDGAKRDRSPWAGDLGVALRAFTIFHGNDLASIRSSLYAMIIKQDNTTGYFPYVGSPFADALSTVPALLYGSDTYHLWTIISFAEYVLANPTSRLFNGTGPNDWARIGFGGGSISPNVLLYHALVITSQIADVLEQRSSNWQDIASDLKTTINTKLYDEQVQMFFDNTTSAGRQLYPQDGNALAVHFNVTASSSQAKDIVTELASRLTKYGSPSPERPGAISPFISSLELFAHLDATPEDASRALSLIRTAWGYMLDAFSNSSLIEGYGDDGALVYPFYPGSYGPPFISHAHAWSTGPLYILSARIAGLRASGFDVSVNDGTWTFQPAVHNSGLDFVRTDFVRKTGAFSVSWSLSKEQWLADISVPEDLSGTVYIPTFGACAQYFLDGQEIDAPGYDIHSQFIRIAEVRGGQHIVQAIF